MMPSTIVSAAPGAMARKAAAVIDTDIGAPFAGVSGVKRKQSK
jgi:hypothetical protein